ncbi:MAG: helix-turn-helix domain-containing protein, partial [Bacteroidaceae bacterium]|nr:helix-turn-helix domain-containing protein [Bacteroidaceae bacterium]
DNQTTTLSDANNQMSGGSAYTHNDGQEHNPVMNLAWQFITETNVSVFLTGKAGTGKTTFLRKLREQMPKRMVVLAPTGVAAINAQGQTIHSFFQLPFGPMVPGAQVERKSYFRVSKEKKNIIKTLDLLVIDEISMVRCDLLDAVDGELRKYKDRTKPFGGVQLLLIGDLQQLAPVAKETEWQLLAPYYSSPYFFGSKALQEMKMVTVELKHIYRQSDASFIDLLAKVRTNTMDDAALASLNARYVDGFVPPEGEEWIRLTTHNNMANAYNDKMLDSLTSYPMTFNCEVKGNFPETSYPADEKLILKVGAQVMFIKNDPSGNHEYYNGKIGTVRGMDNDGNIIVWCKEDNRNISVGQVVWENTHYVIDEKTKEIKEDVEGTFRQYPLRLAWAITVHKSQGLTFEHAVLDINSSFAHGQTYVALSRCRTLEGMVLAHPISNSSVITDSSVNAYIDKELSETGKATEELPNMRFEYYLSLLDELYSFDTLRMDYMYLTRVVDEHLYHQYPEFLQELKNRTDVIDKALVGVAASFRNQYMQIMTREGLRSELLKQRINASAEYFLNKLIEIFFPLMKMWDIKIGNKAVKTQYGNALDSFRLSLTEKVCVFKYIGSDGFSVKSYLSAKAKSSLEELRVPVKKAEAPSVDDLEVVAKNKKEKKVKRQKGDSERETLAMFREGKTIDEIARERSLTKSTIESHLASFIPTGEVALDDIVAKERQIAILNAAMKFSNEERSYTVVKESLPDDYSYGEIRLVFNAHLRKDEPSNPEKRKV